MTYDEIRPLIKTGDVLAWSFRKGWFSSWYAFKINLVRLFTRSEYSHVGIAVVFGKRVFVLESVTGGVRLIPLSLELPFYWIPYKQLDETELERALSVCGQPYSQWEAALGRFDATDETNGKWQCSEFVKWVHRLDCPATPANVVEYVLSQGNPLGKVLA